METSNADQHRASNSRNQEAGVALVIVIIALLIVTAVAAGMIILSNTEVNVDANYKDEQVALFAAKAGLQEARDRMLAGNANPLTLPAVLPGGAGSYATYIIAPGISPSTSGTYYDTEFANELNGTMTLPSGTGWYTTVATNSSYSGSSTNPMPYEWVRVNLKVDRSSYTSSGTPYYVDGASGNAGKQVYYDWTNLHECVTGTGTCATSSNLQPVYEITSLAVTPYGTRRMLQDEVTPMTFNLNFPSALTMAGPVASFSGAHSNPYQVNGTDGSGSAPAVPGCNPNPNTKVAAIGATSNSSVSTIDSGIPGNRQGNYTGSCGSTPCVTTVTLGTAYDNPADLNQTLQMIEQSANVALIPTSPPAGGQNYGFSDVTNAMPGGSWSNPSNNPQIIYIDGNFDLGPNTGSGLLVVTGNFSYHGNSGWNGIILVVGNGTTTFNGAGGGNGQFDGAIFIATTRDANGNPLSSFGQTNFNISGGGGNGIYFNSCWMNYVQKPQTYQLLSSKEVSK